MTSPVRSFPLGLLACALLCAPAWAGGRRAVIVGANTGWAMDQPLRHSGHDAQRLAGVLVELGGFEAADIVVLEDPTTEALQAAIARAAAPSELFVLFYSGHADAEHLHLKGAPLSMEALYASLKAHPAKVKLGLVDACQSGSLLAAKGARPAATFAVQVRDALEVEGTAILASSGADELSREARALKGSFFTHHLVSGLRGSADGNRDGKVTLAEAYEYAATRTTLDTANSSLGAQRPMFRYELKGRGEVTLTTLQARTGQLDFTADVGRCFVTDDTERQLFAEVPGGAAVRLSVAPGSYVVKCPVPEGYRVAALTSEAGALVSVKGLPFQTQPLSAGVLKGGFGGGGEDPLAVVRRDAYQHLRDGRTDAAMNGFNQLLAKDLRDTDAYRGKAQVYLAMARGAQGMGNAVEADRLKGVAVRTDPRLADDPELRRLFPQAPRVLPRPPEDMSDLNVQRANPRQFQRLGLGVALINPHGPLSLSVEYGVAEWLQVAGHVSPFILGFGASARFLPVRGAWSPYVALGGGVTLAGLGAFDGPDFTISVNGGSVLARRNTFDRVGYIDAGIQGGSRNWQATLGLAVGYGAPSDDVGFVGVWPSMTFRYFL